MKPILFSTEMVRAILEDRKTVTRRKPFQMPSNYVKIESLYRDDEDRLCAIFQTADDYSVKQVYAPYQSGDILYVREMWNDDWCDHYIYKADGGSAKAAGYSEEPKWRPSIHMPREAARIFLRVTDVRVERLQHAFSAPISPIFELQKEGIDIGDTCRECIENYGEPCCVDTVDEDGSNLYGGECGILDEVRVDFSGLWNSTIKPADRALYGWDANPWVWVIEFERIGWEDVSKSDTSFGEVKEI